MTIMTIEGPQIVDLCLTGISNEVSTEVVKQWWGLAVSLLDVNDPEAPQFAAVVKLLAEVKENGWEANMGREEA